MSRCLCHHRCHFPRHFVTELLLNRMTDSTTTDRLRHIAAKSKLDIVNNREQDIKYQVNFTRQLIFMNCYRKLRETQTRVKNRQIFFVVQRTVAVLMILRYMNYAVFMKLTRYLVGFKFVLTVSLIG